MTLLDIQYMLGNLSFACLLAMVVWYWIRLTFSLNPSLVSVGTIGMATANLSLAGLLLARWFTSGHFPLSNLYESLLFLSWGFTAFHLIMEIISRSDLFGIVTSPVALLTHAFASFSLPKEMQKTTALVPALQSNWLMMHVTVMMISYVALISGSLLALAFLVVNYHDKRTLKNASPILGSLKNHLPGSEQGSARDRIGEGGHYVLSPAGSTVETNLSLKASIGPRSLPLGGLGLTGVGAPSVGLDGSTRGEGEASRSYLSSNQADGTSNNGEVLSVPGAPFSPFAQTLDNLSYRTLGLGFPLLTIGILSGAVWANEAWGSYWSWDPKETWALITWLVFAIYLHTRLSKGWRGNKPALIAVAGFFLVWICYLGVNLLGTGLHSYGWFQARG
uniref:Cytochrome c biogenesis protein CcsA n=1 Tax=Paradoxia multiseta TaxID=249350 RepID=A0A097KNY4_9CHLO|nr:heme attachment to plastid cytochrome c [Paradoxia multiseta]AIT94903.1 heme attachment to plastid cytochrome c [Paradoxia multiseta]